MKNFRKYSGEKIPDIIFYIKEYIKDKPSISISVGCDSDEKRRGVLYAVTIMLYDSAKKDGVHVVFKTIYVNGKLDTFTRLYKEAEYALELADQIEKELSDYVRKDIDDASIRKYKLHLDQHKGNNIHIDVVEEERLLTKMLITDEDRNIPYKKCDIHLDYNLQDGNGQNKSFNVTQSAIPWLKSNGYRVWCKPYSPASTSAADSLV